MLGLPRVYGVIRAVFSQVANLRSYPLSIVSFIIQPTMIKLYYYVNTTQFEINSFG